MESQVITGTHATRLAARDGLTIRDGAVVVRPVGWTGDAAGANVADYFSASGIYLGPDAYGLEPRWQDADWDAAGVERLTAVERGLLWAAELANDM